MYLAIIIPAFIVVLYFIKGARSGFPARKARSAASRTAQRPVKRSEPISVPRPASRLAQDVYEHQRMLARHPETRKMTVHFE